MCVCVCNTKDMFCNSDPLQTGEVFDDVCNYQCTNSYSCSTTGRCSVLGECNSTYLRLPDTGYGNNHLYITCGEEHQCYEEW